MRPAAMSPLFLALAGLLPTLAACGDEAPASPDDTTSDTASEVTQDAAPEVGDADTAGPDDTLDGSPDATTPEPAWGQRGPYRVGYRYEFITYTPRDGSPERTLRLTYWYPTDATSGSNVLYAGFLPVDDVLGEVPVAAGAGPMPTVLFSHGNTSFAEQSHFFTEYLASHGFLVAAPDHTTNTFFDAGNPVVDIFHWRPLDIGAVLDHLDTLESPHFLSGHVDDGRVAISGHSFGGYTALTATGAEWDVDGLFDYCVDNTIPLGGCEALAAHEDLYRAGFGDPRIRASIPMSPGAVFAFGDEGVASVTAPTLLLTGALDRTTPNADDGDPAWEALSARPDNVRVDFATGAHFTFSNACDLSLPGTANDGCGPDFIDPAEAFAVINSYAHAFLALHLDLDPRGGALLDPDTPLHEDATLSIGGR